MNGPILIGGVPRSGTTLFRAMLHAHPHLHCGPERKLVAPLVRAQREWWQVYGPMLVEANITRAAMDASAGAYLRELLRQSTPPGLRPAEKTPNTLLFLEELGRMLPDARFIQVVRDGRAVAASLVRQDWVDPKNGQKIPYTRDVRAAAEFWLQYLVEVARQIQTVQGRYLEVRYELLVTQPEATLRRVLDFLGEPWDEAVLHHERAGVQLPDTEASSEAVSHGIHTAALSSWQRQLTAGQVATIEAVAGRGLTALGYLTPRPTAATAAVRFG